MRLLKWIVPAALVWLGYFVLMTPLVLIGFIVVAVAAAVAPQRHDANLGTHWPTWLWLYDNDENGIDGDIGALPPGWLITTLHWPEWRRIFVWSAWRNSVGNARWTKLFGMTVDPRDVALTLPESFRPQPGTAIAAWQEYRKLGPYIARQGFRFEMRLPYKFLGAQRFFWIGWRIAQCDTVTKGVGFAFQPWGEL